MPKKLCRVRRAGDKVVIWGYDSQGRIVKEGNATLWRMSSPEWWWVNFDGDDPSNQFLRRITELGTAKAPGARFTSQGIEEDFAEIGRKEEVEVWHNTIK